jgi:hypothetical protein
VAVTSPDAALFDLHDAEEYAAFRGVMMKNSCKKYRMRRLALLLKTRDMIFVDFIDRLLAFDPRVRGVGPRVLVIIIRYE